ncbi:hypothetical protein E3G44_000604 [Mycobacteroides abscessus]|nr:hypothetical protein [Mycobacteroides abscessus]SHQ04539.1 Uncharacterised protein [Mycobacteroides abscessus subsp. abscessus]RIT97475.1 hypothetical protein D2F00_17165 [Mycobacteroides abscessus]SHQ70839.1 Uncharacterised protein [Mycobacteroides abscessus subsp. abscessus]SHQ84053.1 Uncharacterised protein [Mycobacteroides abscessus subsp. abscessus]
MSAPPFTLLYTDEAQAVMDDLLARPRDVKTKKVKKALRLLRDVGPSHPGLESHKYHSLKGPNGEDVWESYVENHTPSAWRIWWVYGPDTDMLTITTVGPHP